MAKNTALEDSEILELFAQEKSKEYAFTVLMNKYQKEVYYQIRRVLYLHEDTNDVSQNVWLKVWRHLDSFRKDASLKTWIQRICVNESLTFLTQKKKQINPNDEDYELELISVAADEGYYSPNEIQRLLSEAIARLPEKQRNVFKLRYYQEMPYEEMSKVLSTSVGSLKASYHIAQKKVEEWLRANA